jgi:hypothetical protein
MGKGDGERVEGGVVGVPGTVTPIGDPLDDLGDRAVG